MPSSELDALEAAHAIHRLLHDRGVTADVVHPGADLTATPSSSCPALPRHRRARRRRRRGGRGRRPGGRHVLLRHQRRARPRASRRLPRRVPRPARRAGRGVLPARPRRDGAARRRHRHVVERGRHRPPGHRGRVDVCRRAPRRAPRGHATRRRRAAPRGTSAPCPTTSASAPLLDACCRPPASEPTVAGLPHGVEATRRSDGYGSWLFLLNHTDAEQTVPATGHDLVTDESVDGAVRLAPGGAAVIREE